MNHILRTEAHAATKALGINDVKAVLKLCCHRMKKMR